MYTAHDEIDLAGRSPSRVLSPILEARLHKSLPPLVLAGAALFGLLFPLV